MIQGFTRFRHGAGGDGFPGPLSPADARSTPPGFISEDQRTRERPPTWVRAFSWRGMGASRRHEDTVQAGASLALWSSGPLVLWSSKMNPFFMLTPAPVPYGQRDALFVRKSGKPEQSASWPLAPWPGIPFASRYAKASPQRHGATEILPWNQRKTPVFPCLCGEACRLSTGTAPWKTRDGRADKPYPGTGREGGRKPVASAMIEYPRASSHSIPSSQFQVDRTTTRHAKMLQGSW